MSDTKITFRLFSPWAFDAEILALDRASEKGWQLQSATTLNRNLIFDNTVRYRYTLDYQKEEPGPDYLLLFADQGWEHVCVYDAGTSGQWHCFRKKYDPALPEEEYMIYTDSASFFQMQQSWTRTYQVLGGACALALIYLLRSPSLSAVLRLGSVLSLEAGAWLRSRAMWQTQPHAAQLRRSALGVYGTFSLGVALLLVNIIIL